MFSLSSRGLLVGRVELFHHLVGPGGAGGVGVGVDLQGDHAVDLLDHLEGGAGQHLQHLEGGRAGAQLPTLRSKPARRMSW